MSEKTKHILAQTFSGIFHPLIMPLYLAIVLLFMHPLAIPVTNIRYKWYALLVVSYAFILLPVGILFILKKIKKISSINLNNQKERFLPLLLIAVCYVIGLRLLRIHQVPATITLILLLKGVCLAIIIVTIISTFWKISAHTTSIGGALGIIMLLAVMYKIDLTYVAITVCLIAGGIGWSRLYLKRHTLQQIIYGFLTGFCAITTSFYLHLLIK